jgi:hypothetical protein
MVGEHAAAYGDRLTGVAVEMDVDASPERVQPAVDGVESRVHARLE